MDTPTMKTLLAAARRLLPTLIPAFKGRWGIFHGDGLYAIEPDFDAAATLAYRTFTPGKFLLVEIVPSPGHFGEEDEHD